MFCKDHSSRYGGNGAFSARKGVSTRAGIAYRVVVIHRGTTFEEGLWYFLTFRNAPWCDF